jgi:hypothetical protein
MSSAAMDASANSPVIPLTSSFMYFSCCCSGVLGIASIIALSIGKSQATFAAFHMKEISLCMYMIRRHDRAQFAEDQSHGIQLHELEEY